MITLADLVNKYGENAVLTIRDKSGNAALVGYHSQDEGLLSPDEDVVHLLSQNSIHELEGLHQSGDLDFFSVVVVDV